MGRLIFGACYCIMVYVIGVLTAGNWVLSDVLKGPVSLLQSDSKGILLGSTALILCGLSFCGSAIVTRPKAIVLIALGILAWHLTGLLYLCAKSSV